MDQCHLKKGESISSSIPTYESFSSQQNNIMEDQVECENTNVGNTKKRKAPPRPRKTTSECWKYFDPKMEPDEDGNIIKFAYCKWCDKSFKADSKTYGTRHLNTHYMNCDKNPDCEKLKKQKILAFKKKIGVENDEAGSSMGTLETWKYDDKEIKKVLIELVVLAELPFKFVEHPAFIKFGKKMQPRFNMPFMVLTAHFIDDDWVMHKRIINFRPIHSHRGVDIGREILECINGWGIKNVMTITVDNIASNDKAIEYLVENLPSKYDDGKHLHIRCMAHILNLIVKDGLKTFNKEVSNISLAGKYIKHSSQRVTNFKESIEKTSTSKKFLVSECPTRWNSTHDMLNTAIELKEAFFYYDFNNSSFARDLEEIPKRVDFEVCRKVVSFLEKFKETTELVSNVSCPVSHLWFGEVLDIDKHLREWQHENASFKEMVEDMRKKYDKYWGDYKKINHYMYFAVMLDPTMKSEMIDIGFTHLIENGCIPMEVDEDSYETPLSFLTDDEVCDKMVKKVEKDLRVLFDMYKEKYGTNLSSDLPKETSCQSTNTSSRRGNSFFFNKKQGGNNHRGVEDELTKYLKEPCLELECNEYFDILNWWKLNSPRFPIVSKMAKDILSIQVSTVASKSSFSVSGRVLDPYRNSLSPSIVEALVCTQDWIRTSSRNITLDTLEDLMKDDELAKERQKLRTEQHVCKLHYCNVVFDGPNSGEKHGRQAGRKRWSETCSEITVGKAYQKSGHKRVKYGRNTHRKLENVAGIQSESLV
ncbi:zinc finger BED domain-containing protein RICESLEEPER 2 [Artemisia annua]|uniref:Zinc finger BED domain-containing protein RICESLEEPER 2 n=1 Tax=Artemisia annua TaxID=35608 RepID=A0A2U1N076_ARTAN|nr:zinc finger BED domain-containing protein RICESLEEPER 2 [Artemisia annua]